MSGENKNHPSEKKSFTFQKNERLCAHNDVEYLFAKGKTFFIHPIKVLYLAQTGQSQLPQILFSVPKKFHKRAHDRNLLKRRLREAYRKNKHLLISSENPIQWKIGFLYLTNEKLEYKMIEEKLISAFKRLNDIGAKIK